MSDNNDSPRVAEEQPNVAVNSTANNDDVGETTTAATIVGEEAAFATASAPNVPTTTAAAVVNRHIDPTPPPQLTTPETPPPQPIPDHITPCLCCDHCHNVLCRRSDIISEVAETFSDQVYTYDLDILQEMYPVYSATNPAAVRFDVGRVAAECVDKKMIACGKVFSDQHSWFPPYQWCFASCGACGQHLGWGFAEVDAEKMVVAKAEFNAKRLDALQKLKEADEQQGKKEGSVARSTASSSSGQKRGRSVESVTDAQKQTGEEQKKATTDAENEKEKETAPAASSEAAATAAPTGDNDAEGAEEEDDAFHTANSDNSGGEEEEMWEDADEEDMEMEEGDDEEGESPAMSANGTPSATILADIADASLHKYWVRLPSELQRKGPATVMKPLAFVGLIVTRCEAKETATKEFVEANIAGAPARAAADARYQAQRQSLFRLLNSVPNNLRGMANSIGMLAYQIHNNFAARGGMDRVYAEAEGLVNIGRQLTVLAGSGPEGEILAQRLLRGERIEVEQPSTTDEAVTAEAAPQQQDAVARSERSRSTSEGTDALIDELMGELEEDSDGIGELAYMVGGDEDGEAGGDEEQSATESESSVEGTTANADGTADDSDAPSA